MALSSRWQAILRKIGHADDAHTKHDEESAQLFQSSLGGHIDLMRISTEALDVFKGVLVIIMTWAHVDLTLMSAAEQYLLSIPHFIGNAAASLCFLGFMFSYGFSCDLAYLSDWKKRDEAERTGRMLRSAMLPVLGAWCCAFGWGFMCFKLPLDFETVLRILDFRITLGNGPDFLLCFTTCILVMFSLRRFVNMGFASGIRVQIICSTALLLTPLACVRLVAADCTGLKKYLGYFVECTLRDPFAPVLPALPHLFYFNMGLLFARSLRMLPQSQVDRSKFLAGCLIFAIFSAALTYPLMTVWASNFGNISVPTKFGPITRGFVDGPSVLWLLGNVFPVSTVLAMAFAFQYYLDTHKHLGLWFVRTLRNELAQLGGNVLLYLIVADLCLAGLYRGQGNEPLGQRGCALMTVTVIGITRFLQYLSTSGAHGMARCGAREEPELGQRA